MVPGLSGYMCVQSQDGPRIVRVSRELQSGGRTGRGTTGHACMSPLPDCLVSSRLVGSSSGSLCETLSVCVSNLSVCGCVSVCVCDCCG